MRLLLIKSIILVNDLGY